MENQNKITGIVEQIVDKSGVSKRDGKPYTLKQMLIREVSGNYPQSAVFDVFGDRSDGIAVSDVVDCFFNLGTREYNGSYYNNVTAWRLTKITPSEQGTAYETPTATVHTVAASPEPVPAADLEPKDDDLPF
jgi:hypothetical protein